MQLYQWCKWSTQVYEMSRLLNFQKWGSLVGYSQARQGQGCATWAPILLRCNDGLLHILPGDSR
jgi:hypothetical protein